MKPLVKLVSQPDPKLPRYFLEAAEVDHSLTKELDTFGRRIEGVEALLSILGEFAGAKSRQHLLHLHYGFLIFADQMVNLEFLKQYSHLVAITPYRNFGILYVTGHALALVQIITSADSSDPRLSMSIREITNGMYDLLCSFGLETAFKPYGKAKRSDGTFDLVKLHD